jgi:hypothetical protein
MYAQTLINGSFEIEELDKLATQSGSVFRELGQA